MKNLRFCLMLAALLLAIRPAVAGENIGTVAEAQGAVTVAHAGGASGALKPGDGILPNDVISTDERSRVRVVFVDKTEIVLANKGKLTVDSYVFDPKNPAGSKGRFSVLHAAFSYVGGLLDKGDVRMELDFGSIGIRGTEVYRAMRRNECWIYVKKGAISVSNKGGAVHLKEGEGTRMSAQTKAPEAAHTWSANEINWIVGETANPQTQHGNWK
jgi:hypothetical protein